MNEREKWRGASIEERLKAFDDIWVEAKYHQRVLDTVKDKLDYVRLTGVTEGILVVCDSGGGKTKLSKHLVKLYPDEELEDRTLRRTVIMNIPKVCTKSGLAKALLKALGDPAWDMGKAGENLDRAVELVASCGVLILAVDNFHDIPERRDRGAVRVVGNWFRDLLDMIAVVFIAFGTKEAKKVRISNNQVRRRCVTSRTIPYFSVRTLDEGVVWKKVVHDFDKALPMAESSGLAEKALFGRITVATNGIFDYLGKLLKRAMTVAVRRGSERIEVADLAGAFEFIAGDVADGGNPFHDGFKSRKLTKIDELFYEEPEPGKKSANDDSSEGPEMPQAA